MEHADWLSSVFNPEELRTISARITSHILRSPHKIDTIASCGLSGICVASVVSAQTNIPMTVVRKEKEKAHSPYKIEWGISCDNPFQYIIIDDLIDTGNTIRLIFDRISLISGDKGKPKAIYLYHVKHHRTHFLHVPIYFVDEHLMEENK